VAWLLERTDDEVEHMEPALHRMRDALPPRLRDLLEEGERLSRLERLPARTQGTSEPSRTGVPARKWRQIQRFVANLEGAAEFVDWCAGKGHLGRTVGRIFGGSGMALEIDPILVGEGIALAEREGVELSFQITDVLDPALDIGAGRRVLALHACGNLGDRALRVVASSGASGLAWAPCCFHRGRDRFDAWSESGRASGFAPTQDELRLPTTDETVAEPHVRWQRRTAMAYRLGFDHLREQASGVQGYRSFPSVPDSWLNGGFEAFARNVADRFDIPIPAAPDWRDAERKGAERAARARRLGLLRAAFRRPFEVWLALDRAVWLEEQGMAVRVGTFCERAVTPRNILVLAGALVRADEAR
jgi:hypothetical protein